jgi:hypothetical protein
MSIIGTAARPDCPLAIGEHLTSKCYYYVGPGSR